ncbi:MAG: DUF1015 domain-containing protein [Acidimicrobiales bacterium]
MPRFEPFAGLRYDTPTLAAHDTTLDQVVAPPYDVVDPPERAALSLRSRWNAVRVELPEDNPAAGRDRYQEAAALLAAWEAEGTLRLDGQAAFYLYQMTFDDGAGERRRTSGVIGALEAAPPGEGDVLPHERTTPKPKSDRLDLLRACRANLSPVWGLSLASGLSELCRPRGEAAATARDDDGVVHELWPVTDPDALAAICSTVGSAPVVLADGHHRYETSAAYRDERRAANGGAAGDYDLVMALVVELARDQLAVGPIHRLVAGIPDDLDLTDALSRRFELRPVDLPRAAQRSGLAGGAGRLEGGAGRLEGGAGGPAGGAGELPTLHGPAGRAAVAATLEKAGGPALLTRAGAWTLHATAATRRAAEYDVDSSQLDLALADLPPHQLSYHHDPGEVLAAVADGRASAGVLVRPAPVDVIAAAARDRRRMPAKTTFFTPKPRTGMVIRPVRG